MKLSKPLLQAIAIAVTVSTVSSCTKDKVIDPKAPKGEEQTQPINCPACGMG